MSHERAARVKQEFARVRKSSKMNSDSFEALLDNRELVAILQLVAALSPDERREIYQVAAEKKRLTDLEEQVADLRSRLKSDSR